jgi:hypothetical protein
MGSTIIVRFLTMAQVCCQILHWIIRFIFSKKDVEEIINDAEIYDTMVKERENRLE